MMEYFVVFAGGFLGSAHCVGMCGPLVTLVGMSPCSPGRALTRQLVYCAGRVFTYTFLGIMAGFAGGRLVGLSDRLVDVQRLFSMIAGVTMIVIGLSTLGAFRVRFALPGSVAQPFARFYRHFLNAPATGTVFISGSLNGFLPCGLVYAFLAMALSSGNPGHGGLLMLFFGLGTVPAMTVLGCGGSLVGHAMRARIYRLAACLVLLAGGITIYRSIPTSGNCCEHAIADPVPIVSG